MPIYSFKLPDIGEGIAEAEIVTWHAQVGDMFEEDDPLCDLMTDKATVEMTAPVTGKLVKIAGVVGDQIPIGSILAEFEVAVADTDVVGSDVLVASSERAEAATGETAPETGPVADRQSVSDLSRVPSREVALSVGVTPAAEEPVSADEKRVLASPAVRARAKNLGIDLSRVTSAGHHIRHADLDAFLTYNKGGGYQAAGAKRADEQIRVVGLRRRIAENMSASKRAIPHFTYVEELDVTKLEALRADLNATRGTGPKLTILPLLIVAICRAIPDFPMINARYDDEAGIVTRHGAMHIGIATQTDAGLMVPVIRNAQDRNIWQLASEITRLANGARAGKVASEELSGSTLTITSLGLLGGIATTPVINRPEVAIIGPNKIVERPTFRDGAVVAAKLMNMSVSCDHRVVDGWDAASFVQLVKYLIENPALLFSDRP